MVSPNKGTLKVREIEINKGIFSIPLFIKILDFGSNKGKFPYLCSLILTHQCTEFEVFFDKIPNFSTFFSHWIRLVILGVKRGPVV